MNNNLSLSDLQNKYRDQGSHNADNKTSPKMTADRPKPSATDSVIASSSLKTDEKKRPDQHQSLNVIKPNESSVEQTAQENVKTWKIDKKNKVKLKKLDSTKGQINEGPIMAFLLFSGLAMFVGVMLLVTNSTSATKSPQVLGQSTGTKPTTSAKSSIVEEVQKSIDATNDEHQKKYQEVKNDVAKVEENIDPVDTQSSSETEETENSEPKQDELVQQENTLDLYESTQPAVQEEPVLMVRIKPNAQGGVNLRSEPNGATKSSALSGEEFEMVSEQSGWIEIKYSETENLWVLADLVEKI